MQENIFSGTIPCYYLQRETRKNRNGYSLTVPQVCETYCKIYVYPDIECAFATKI